MQVQHPSSGIGSVAMDVTGAVMTASLGRWLPILKSTSREEGSLGKINTQVSATKASLEAGGHRLWFDLERDSLRQVYLLRMNEFLSGFQP